MKEWEKYKCAEPSRAGFTLNTPTRLTAVQHVVHLEHAYNILRDKKLRAGLVFDKSVLNTERILVNWLSPNHWHYGSRYGNVTFSFDFEKLVENKNIYWVEAINYGIPAPRFLITSNDYTDHSNLIEYDPEVENGPLIKRDGIYYWKDNITLELMLEEDIATRRIKSVSFTEHNQHQCKIDPKSCPDRGVNANEARKLFFATVLDYGVPLTQTHYIEKDEEIGRYAQNNLRDGIRTILEDVRNCDFKGSITDKSKSADALVYSALTFLGQRETKLFEETIILFRSYEDFRAKFLDLTIKRFKLPDTKSLRSRHI